MLTVLRSWASNIDLERFEPCVIIGGNSDSKTMRALKINSVPVYRAPPLISGQGWLLPSLISLIRIFRAREIDIVHTMGVQSDILGTIAAKLAGGIVIVSSVVGSLFRTNTMHIKKCMYRLLYRMVHPHFERIIAVSQKTRADLISDFGVPSDKVHVVHLGLDKSVLGQGGMIPPPVFRDPVVGTMAELIPEKGICDFIDAVKPILSRVPTARFIVAGDGPERDNLIRKVESQGLADVVKFRGWLPNGLDLFEEVDVFVLPSYEEGLPWVVLEAMACRRPTVASAVGGVPEIITDGLTGLLVEPRDPKMIASAVIRMVHNPEWALQIGEQGRNEVMSRFTYNREIGAIQALYDEMMASNHSSKQRN